MDLLNDILQAGILLLFAAGFFTFLAVIFLVPIAALVFTVVDVFSRDDLSAGKLVWLLVVLAVPFVGMAIYWLAKPQASQAGETTLLMNRASQVPEAGARAATRRVA
jgi:ABC-type transport system involved in cytochrome bd biosynthesis fused ATPase/permease subunit